MMKPRSHDGVRRPSLALGRHWHRAPDNHEAATDAPAGVTAPLSHMVLPVCLDAKGLGDNVVVGVLVAREARGLGQLRPLAAALGQTAEAVAVPTPRRGVMHTGTSQDVRQLV